MASIAPGDKVIYMVDHPITTIMDPTTNTNYIYVSRSLDPARATTVSGWQCYRITVATGELRYAKAAAGMVSSKGSPMATGIPSDDFAFIANNAATYTY